MYVEDYRQFRGVHPLLCETIDKTMDRPPFLPMLIGTGFGSGFSPVAPGTAGALLAALVWYLLSFLLSGVALLWITVALILVFTLAGVWAADRLEPAWGEDPSRVVVDEMVGVWISLLAAPAGHVWYGLAAFVLFRFFDILKPLGIRRMEKLPGGWGVMMDDILSGVYGFILLIVARWDVLQGAVVGLAGKCRRFLGDHLAGKVWKPFLPVCHFHRLCGGRCHELRHQLWLGVSCRRMQESPRGREIPVCLGNEHHAQHLGNLCSDRVGHRNGLDGATACLLCGQHVHCVEDACCCNRSFLLELQHAADICLPQP